MATQAEGCPLPAAGLADTSSTAGGYDHDDHGVLRLEPHAAHQCGDRGLRVPGVLPARDRFRAESAGVQRGGRQCSWLSASRSQPARLPQALCQLRESLPDGRSEFNKIFLDVNGSRDTAAVTKLIAIYSEAWGVGAIELIVVKNWRLANLLRASTLSAAVLLDPPLPQPVAAVAVAVGGDVNSSQGDHAVRAVMGAVVLAAVATVAVLMCTGGGSSGRAAQRCVGTRP